MNGGPGATGGRPDRAAEEAQSSGSIAKLATEGAVVVAGSVRGQPVWIPGAAADVPFYVEDILCGDPPFLSAPTERVRAAALAKLDQVGDRDVIPR
ncbi:MAG: hypothetical protein ABI726_05770 [bacterium]